MKAELLAPAGDFASLKAAVSSGADAVYIGASKFSARCNATNFDKDEIFEAAHYCRVRGVKLYLAINTLIKDGELSEALAVAKDAYEAGVDGYIVQDIGLIKLLGEKFDIPVHASTQMTVFDEYGLEYLKSLGICRAVLSRECKREDILRLCEKNIMELEVFCHGAICMSYSGQCLMSSMIGGRSANRGLCAQPCRLPYECGGKKGYYLSPRDLCLIDEVKALENVGVASLKIEGRMKGPAYVASAVGAYREALDNGKASDEAYNRLLKAFSRGGSFTKGCYGSVRGRAMMNVSESNDNVMRTSDRAFEKELEHLWKGNSEIKKVPINVSVKIKDKTYLTFDDGNISVTVSEQTPTEVCGKKTDLSFARAQISKLGSTPFFVNNFSYEEEKDAYFKASALNDLRRRAADLLVQKRGEGRVFSGNLDFSVKTKKKCEKPYIAVSVQSRDQAVALVKAGARVYVPYDMEHVEGAYAAIIPNIYKELPKKTDYPFAVVGSVGALEYAKRQGKQVIADYSMNIFNSVAAAEFEKVTLSPELTLSEMKKIAAHSECEAIVYGYIPVMTTENCVIKTVGKCASGECANCRKTVLLTDRKNASFKVRSNGKTNTIYNSVPIFTADKLDEFLRAGFSGLRLYFTDETPEEAVKIYKMYSGEVQAQRPNAYTRGHFYNGV